MTYTFYEMAEHIIGVVPIHLTWLYDFTTLCLVCCAFALFIIPISLIFKGVVHR